MVLVLLSEGKRVVALLREELKQPLRLGHLLLDQCKAVVNFVQLLLILGNT